LCEYYEFERRNLWLTWHELKPVMRL
jgi:hypothetical protein